MDTTINDLNLSPRFETLSSYTIIKRDGREEPFYLDKLIKVIRWASESTKSPNVITEQLLNELSMKIVDKMHISDLYDEAINIAVAKISAIQPQWDDVAKYLYLLKIYKENFRLKRIGSYPSITKFIERGIKKSVYDPNLFESFSPEEIDEIDNMIDPNRDLIFNYKGLRLFFDKYCKNSHGKTKTKKVELPQITFMIAAMHSYFNEPHETKEEKKKRLKHIERMYNALSNHEVTFATPMISNAGKKGAQFASCVLITVDDDTYSIVNTVGWCALYSKFKGGIAFDVSYIRSSGSSILSNDGYSDGPIPFIKIVEQTVSSFNQGGCCGSNTLVTVIQDVELTNGEVYQFRKPKIDIDQEITDFIENYFNNNNKSINNNDIEIKNINTVQIFISEVKIGDYVKSFNKDTKEIEFKRVDDTFKFDIDLSRQYLLEFENGAKVVTSDHHPIFYSVNGSIHYKRTDEMQKGDLCITSNNENINTKLINITKLDKKQKFFDLTVSGNNNYFAVDSTSQNINNEILIHNTRSGAVIIYFQWWNWDIFNLLTLKDAGGAEELRARKCKYGMKINQLFLERVKNDEYVTLFDPKETRILNETYGEEFEKLYKEFENNANIRSKKVKARDIMYAFFKTRVETGNVYLAHIDNMNHQNVTDRFVSMSNLCCFSGKEKALIKENDEIKEVELEKLAGQTKITWNGHEWSEAKFNKYSDDDRLFLLKFKKYYHPYMSLDEPILEDEVSLRATPNHKWKVWIFSKTNKRIELTITTQEIQILLEYKDHFNIKQIEIMRPFSPFSHKIEDWSYIFDEIIDDGTRGPTYCCDEPVAHMFVVNGIYTHNCEITVPSRPPRLKSETFITTNKNKKEVHTIKTDGEIGLCNLSSINSLKWFNMDSNKKDQLVETLLRGFDNKIESQFYPVAEAEWPNKAYRPIGIGVTDIANLLAEEKLLYSNPKSLQFINDLYDDIYYRIYYQSMLLAKEKGFYEGFRESNWAKGLTPYHLSLYRKNNHLGIEFKNDKKWDKLGKDISQVGVRFSLHATLPPSACCSLDTLINTDKGLKTLKDILNNDLDINTNEIHQTMKDSPTWLYPNKSFTIIDKNGIKRKVTKVYYNGYRLVYDFIGYDGKKYGSFTENHKFYGTRDEKLVKQSNDIVNEPKNEWVTVKELLSIKEFIFIANGKPFGMVPKNRFVNPHYEHTWDFEVEDVHEYCVGEDKIVCHNTSGKVTNATEAAEPIMDLFFVETGTHNLPTVVKGRGETRNFYEKCWDIDPKIIINHAIIRQIYLDQSQSWTQYYTKPESVRELFNDVYYACKNGIKTFYYLKTQKLETEEVCSSCSS